MPDFFIEIRILLEFNLNYYYAKTKRLCLFLKKNRFIKKLYLSNNLL